MGLVEIREHRRACGVHFSENLRYIPFGCVKTAASKSYAKSFDIIEIFFTKVEILFKKYCVKPQSRNPPLYPRNVDVIVIIFLPSKAQSIPVLYHIRFYCPESDLYYYICYDIQAETE